MHAGRIIALDSPDALKSSVFPEPMFEVEAPAGEDWAGRVRELGLGEVHPYGMRHHVAVADPDAWSAFLEGEGRGLSCRPMRPSLEDVFIRVMRRAAS